MLLPLRRRQADVIRRRLLAFYDRHRRDLPWRGSRDPYAILVSEVMLQQTTVAAVVPYYERFLARFPDLRSLARASEEEVLTVWAGLGYYRRARSLREACRQIVHRYGGHLPGTVAALRELPGIGPYTAGAVASIAFNLPEPVLDGNVVRVLARLAARSGRGSGERRLLEQAARTLVEGRRPGDLNQAVMELGATICTPTKPACGACPVARSCSARREGLPEKYPEALRRQSPQQRRGVVLVVRHDGGRVYLVQRRAESLMPGLWELPGLSGQEKDCVALEPRSVARAARRQLGQSVVLGKRLGSFQHTVVNRRVKVEVRIARLRPHGRSGVARAAVRSVDPGRDPMPPVTAATRKALEVAGFSPRAWIPAGGGQ